MKKTIAAAALVLAALVAAPGMANAACYAPVHNPAHTPVSVAPVKRAHAVTVGTGVVKRQHVPCACGTTR